MTLYHCPKCPNTYDDVNDVLLNAETRRARRQLRAAVAPIWCNRHVGGLTSMRAAVEGRNVDDARSLERASVNPALDTVEGGM